MIQRGRKVRRNVWGGGGGKSNVVFVFGYQYGSELWCIINDGLFDGW